ncbi:MAG: transcription-repair coupling factor, partial [Ruminiclostridium sp.]|nr:transcription-repair coupling factor [Ruminiclostridium sp.]
MEYFLNAARQIDEYHALANHKTGLPVMLTGLSHIHKAHFLAALSEEDGFNPPLIVLCDTEGECVRMCGDINTMTGKETALVYPAKDLMLGEVDASSREYEYKRLGVLYRMCEGTAGIVCATPEAAAQLTIPQETLLSRSITVKNSDTINLQDMINSLLALGYSRCDQIEGVSQFSVRGSIFDIYPVNFPLPVRIELWDEDVDNISTFDIETQRRIDTIKKITIAPAAEILFENNRVFSDRLTTFSAKIRGKHADSVKKRIAADIEKLENGILPDCDKYIPLCYNEETSLFDYGRNIIICENSACTESFKSAAAQHSEDLKMLFEDGILCKSLDRYMLTKAEYQARAEEMTLAYLDNFMRGHDIRLSKLLTVSAGQVAPWSGEYKYLLEELKAYMRDNFSVIVFAGTEKG